MRLHINEYIPEWGLDEGVRLVLGRIYIQGRRTSAYVPLPQGFKPAFLPDAVHKKVQEMYAEDNKKYF